MQTDELEIRQLITTWMTASKAGDVKKVLSLMTDDVVFLMSGQSIMREGDFAAAMQAQSHQGRLAIEASSDIQEITVQGDWASMWTRLTVAMTSSNNLERMVRAGHTLTILQKKNGKWLVARDANMLAPVP
jgi:uncharacterized protein (TIGR02246 family)